MNKISRPLVYSLLAVLILAVIAAVIASGHHSFADGPSLIVFDEDMSDSPAGWFIAIPILIAVGVVVAIVCTGAALVTILALMFAFILVLLAMVLVATPIAFFLALPLLAVYGLFKLVQRDRRAMQAASTQVVAG